VFQIPGGLGAYSDSRGALAIRKEARAAAAAPPPALRTHIPHVHTISDVFFPPFPPLSFFLRHQVAEYIKNRDGLKDTPNPDHIFLTGTRPRTRALSCTRTQSRLFSSDARSLFVLSSPLLPRSAQTARPWACAAA
jgi:hypothetical protein